MKMWAFAALAVVIAWPCAAATYANERFGYSVFYPERLLAPQPEAAAGDGRQFRARSGGATFAVFALYSRKETSPDAIERSAEEVCNLTKPALRVARRDLVAMSCIHDGLIYYAKVVLARGIQLKLMAAYAQAERALWDPVVSEMARSLRAGR